MGFSISNKLSIKKTCKRSAQFKLFKVGRNSYGGDLLKTREGRSQGRPLSTRHTMHLVLRSTKAMGPWSFWKKENKAVVTRLVKKFSIKYGIKVHSMANVGNHLHLHLKLSNRHTYAPFIRALTSAIAMAITRSSRWKPLKTSAAGRFWDRRPFTNILKGLRGFLNLRDYVTINQFEGIGFCREQARYYLALDKIEAFENSG